MARGHLGRNPGLAGAGVTIQPTMLANDTLMKLIRQRQQYDNSGHFFAIASRLMMRVLLDYHRTRNARSAAAARSMCRSSRTTAIRSPTSRAGGRRRRRRGVQRRARAPARAGRRKADVVRYRILWGLTVPQISETLGVAVSTIERDWAFAKAWLTKELGRRRRRLRHLTVQRSALQAGPSRIPARRLEAFVRASGAFVAFADRWTTPCLSTANNSPAPRTSTSRPSDFPTTSGPRFSTGAAPTTPPSATRSARCSAWARHARRRHRAALRTRDGRRALSATHASRPQVSTDSIVTQYLGKRIGPYVVEELDRRGRHGHRLPRRAGAPGPADRRASS